MTLDEAILHAEEVADYHDRIKQIKAVTLGECRCADEHRQLAEWLKELKAYKEQQPCGDAISRKWVLDVVNNFVFDTETDRNRIIHIVRDTAPSVMPKEKQEEENK